MDASTVLCSPIILAVGIASLVYLLYRNATSTFNFFTDQGIPGPKPIPIFGSMWGLWKKNIPANDIVLKKKYGKNIGFFDGTTPNLYTTDVELIKSVFVKDIDHFMNKRTLAFQTKVVRKFLNLLRGQEWKDVRSSVTPAFTSGKIKKMSIMIRECADQLSLKLKANSGGKFNAKDEFSAFTMDVIARCAFGMTIKNLGDTDDLFMKNAKKVFSPPLTKSPLMLIPFIFPKLMPLFGEKMFLTKEFMFFINILEDLIKERRQSTEKFHDFIEYATEAISEYKKEGGEEAMWNREEVDEIVIAQSTVFLLAGFDTTASTLTNTIFLLALHPQIQERLYDGIIEKLEKSEEINHDMILDFPFLDHIIHEVLRMAPPVSRVERECAKDVTYGKVHIKKGMMVSVSAFALHNDEEYYPHPETFNPDRWADGKISPYVWMPFGMGPRNCVGMRFAMEEMKLALCTLVKQMRFVRVPETPDKIEFQEGIQSVVQPLHPIIVGIELRE